MSIFDNPYEKAFVDAVLHAGKGGIAVMLAAKGTVDWLPRRLSVNNGAVLVVTDDDVERRLAGVNVTGLFVASEYNCDKRAVELAKAAGAWCKHFAYNRY